MTGYSKKEISYAAELIHLMAEQSPGLSEASNEAAEVASWVECAIRDGRIEALTEFISLCGPAGAETYGMARGLVRTVGSIFQVDGTTRLVFAIPFMCESSSEFTLRSLECRQRIERALELARDLPFLSLRLCQHPIRRVELDALGPLELESVGRDLVRYAASKKLRAPVIGPGPENLIWLGVYKVPHGDARSLFAVPKGVELQEWRHKARACLEEELKPLSVSYADVFFPMRIPEAITASRLYQLKTELNTCRVGLGANKLAFQRAGGSLNWVLTNTVTGESQQGDMWVPDESTELLESSLRSFARRNDMELVPG